MDKTRLTRLVNLDLRVPSVGDTFANPFRKVTVGVVPGLPFLVEAARLGQPQKGLAGKNRVHLKPAYPSSDIKSHGG